MSGQENGQYPTIYTLFNDVQHKEETCVAHYRQPLAEYDRKKTLPEWKAWEREHPVLAQFEHVKHKVVVSIAEHNIEHQCTLPAARERTALGNQLSVTLFR